MLQGSICASLHNDSSTSVSAVAFICLLFTTPEHATLAYRMSVAEATELFLPSVEKLTCVSEREQTCTLPHLYESMFEGNGGFLP